MVKGDVLIKHTITTAADPELYIRQLERGTQGHRYHTIFVYTNLSGHPFDSSLVFY